MKEKGFSLLAILLSIFLLSAAISTIVIVKIRQKPQKQPESIVTTTPATTKFTCTPQPSQKNDGSVYVNKEFGFSAKPPVNWDIYVECAKSSFAEVTIEAPDSGEEVSPGEIPPHYFVRKFKITVEQRNKNSSILELEQEIRQNPFFNSPITTVQRTKINDKDALRLGEWSIGGITNIYIPNNQKIYSIHHLEFVEFESVENPRYVEEFEKFLSSFKLLN